MLLCCALRVDRDENVKNNANCLKVKELLGRIILKNSKEISFFS